MKTRRGNSLTNTVTTTYNKHSNKLKTGAGFKKTLKKIVTHTKKHIKKLKPSCKKALMELAYVAAKDFAADLPIKLPRIVPVPKTGGFLPLVPIFAGLSAAGSLAGGAAGIAKAINAYKTARKQLTESERHNKEMETLLIGKGLHLKPYKDGLGIYITEQKN